MLLLHLAAAPSVLAVYATAAACGIALVQLGDAGLHQQGSSNASAHVRSRGQVAVHSRTPAVAARMPRQQCWSLTCVLGPQQTAAVAAAAACCCLIQSSQRCSEACRIRAVWYLLRLSAFRPGDRSWMVRWTSPRQLHRTIHGRTAEREVASGEMYRKTRKTRILWMSLLPLLGRRARTRSSQ